MIAAIPDEKMKGVMIATGKLWKEMDDEAKAEYTTMAAEDKKRYDKEMEVYVPLEKIEVYADGSPVDSDASANNGVDDACCKLSPR